jgi:hypothetical protein
MFGKRELPPAKKLKKYIEKVPLFKHTTTIEFRNGRADIEVVGTDFKSEHLRKVSLVPNFNYNYKKQDKHRDKYEVVDVIEVFFNSKAPFLNNGVTAISGDNKSVSFMTCDILQMTSVKEQVGEVETVRYDAI